MRLALQANMDDNHSKWSEDCMIMKLCKTHLMHYSGIRCARCEDEYVRTKKAMMQRMRKEREKEGLKRCEFWLTPEQKERVLKYVARLKRDV